MPVEIMVSGLAEFQQRMRRRTGKLADLRGVNLAAAVEVQGWTMRNMQVEGGLHADGKLLWPPLKLTTMAARAKRGKWPGRMLQVNGRLIGSFEASATGNEGRVVNRVGYARYHEEGTRKMPQRKMFPAGAQGAEIVEPVYRRFVEAAIE